MNIEPGKSYHIYNQGNNRQRIFFERENYLFFLRKMRTHLLNHCDILAYCLMPNHFHWLIQVNPEADKQGEITKHTLNKDIATLLSSYTQAINNRYNKSGSLFRHKTKAVRMQSKNQTVVCFHYIHQNPIRAGLVSKMGKWAFTSFPDYTGKRNGNLVSKNLTETYLELDAHQLAKQSGQALDPRLTKKNRFK